MRGWKGLAMVEASEVQNTKNASVKSGRCLNKTTMLSSLLRDSPLVIVPN